MFEIEVTVFPVEDDGRTGDALVEVNLVHDREDSVEALVGEVVTEALDDNRHHAHLSVEIKRVVKVPSA